MPDQDCAEARNDPCGSKMMDLNKQLLLYVTSQVRPAENLR